jgi:hypothetical protein
MDEQEEGLIDEKAARSSLCEDTIRFPKELLASRARSDYTSLTPYVSYNDRL